MSSGRRQFSTETLVLLGLGAAFLGVGVFICIVAMQSQRISAQAVAPPVVAQVTPMLPPATLDTDPTPPESFAPAPEPTSIFASPPDADVPAELRPRSAPERQTSPSIVLGSLAPAPPIRPIELNAPGFSPTPVPGRRSDIVELGLKPGSLSQYDHFTAVYDLTAHVVYLPDGARLEAHSGLGALKDDPAHVDEKDRGATPPHLYDLTLREDMFHGVQALRLNPVGGAAAIFGRAGLLAHTYMLGAEGDSNGCVSFKNYDAFLQAFQSGLVKRLAVVSSVR